jgi:deoxyribose-phosphate aldolase
MAGAIDAGNAVFGIHGSVITAWPCVRNRFEPDARTVVNSRAMNLAGTIEHTLLRADATRSDVEAHCAAAANAGLFGVCVSPIHARFAKECLRGSRVVLVTVVGFPLGASAPVIKSAEAKEAAKDGADEIDMVMDLGAARAGDWATVEADVRAVRSAVPERVLKVILETGYFSSAEIRRAAEAVIGAGADFVKTSTGFGPRGGTVEDVVTLREVARDRARVKASGGIRDRATALAMLEAGAHRIGTSNGVAIAAP